MFISSLCLGLTAPLSFVCDAGDWTQGLIPHTCSAGALHYHATVSAPGFTVILCVHACTCMHVCVCVSVYVQVQTWVTRPGGMCPHSLIHLIDPGFSYFSSFTFILVFTVHLLKLKFVNGKMTEKSINRAGGMAQWAKACVGKPDNLNSIPWDYMMEGKSQLPLLI